MCEIHAIRVWNNRLWCSEVYDTDESIRYV